VISLKRGGVGDTPAHHFKKSRGTANGGEGKNYNISLNTKFITIYDIKVENGTKKNTKFQRV